MTKSDMIKSNVLEGEYMGADETRGQERDRKAAEAWEFIERDGSWKMWLRVADGLSFLQGEAMRISGTNQPYGRGFQNAFAELAKTRPYARDLDKNTQKDCRWCIGHLPEISAWRETLDANKRAKFNHPTTVRRHFEKAVNEEEKKEKPEPKPGSLIETLKATIRELEAEVSRLEGLIFELQMEIEALKAEIAKLKGATR